MRSLRQRFPLFGAVAGGSVNNLPSFVENMNWHDNPEMYRPQSVAFWTQMLVVVTDVYEAVLIKGRCNPVAKYWRNGKRLVKDFLGSFLRHPSLPLEFSLKMARVRNVENICKA